MGEQMVHRVYVGRNRRHELKELVKGPIFAVGLFFNLVDAVAKDEYLCTRIESNGIAFEWQAQIPADRRTVAIQVF